MPGDILKDERFAHIKTDPRFRHMPKSERKVKIDKRFQGMFKDRRFKEKYTVDKRGRQVNLTTSEDLKKFYELSDSEDEDDHEDTKKKAKKKKNLKDKGTELKSHIEKKVANRDSKKTLKANKKEKQRGQSKTDALKPKEEISMKVKRDKVMTKKLQQTVSKRKALVITHQDDSDDHGDEDNEEEEEDSMVESFEKDDKSEQHSEHSEDEIKGPGADDSDEEEEDDDDEDEEEEEIDFARGKGNIASSSDSDSDEEFTFDNEIDVEHKWGELDADAETTEEISCRLALCNMDWDRIKAQDLLVLFNSFKPTGGIIKSVKIYLSDFGKERMKEEEMKGPKELVESDREVYKQLDQEGEKYHTEKLRQYQMNRLKYYYAVIECDTSSTANAIYEECDGLEYQNSSTKLDLRFIPDDITFEDEPVSVASDIPESYKPSEFMTSALQQTKVNLTWDETDKDRLAVTTKKFSKDEVMELDFQAYLASSSDEESEQKKGLPEVASGSDENDDGNDEDTIAKYRELLKGLDDKEEKHDKEMEMDIRWEPGLKETTEELVKKKDETEDLTSWQQYQKKKKEKKKAKKTEEKKKREEVKKQREGVLSDDELPPDVDLNDPYFKEALDEESRKAADGKDVQKKKKKKKRQEEELTEEELAEKKQKEAELELLLMEDDDDRQHFSLKAIMDAEKEAKKKRKKKKKKHDGEEKFEDKFQLDTEDPRFSAIYESHHFQIDPSDPQFKKTKAMETIIQEKQKRRKHKEIAGQQPPEGYDNKAKQKRTNSKSPGQDPSLSMLVKSVKNKTDQFHARKQKKLKLN
ncbi:ESF1 homolog [Ptychodera flava]|uniref:ESF1 homolog n=1 Tax=Ptychodera flava TaxID=63121 RepID=UPI00396A994B